MRRIKRSSRMVICNRPSTTATRRRNTTSSSTARRHRASPMSTRTSDDTVTFLHPFRLSGVDELQPAGRYVVETDEEPLPTVSLPAYRRLSTFIHLAGRPDSNELARVVDVDPAELAAALARDAAVQDAARRRSSAPLPGVKKASVAPSTL